MEQIDSREIQLAWKIARRIHKNQTRNDGKTPYINHVKDVVNTLIHFEFGYIKADKKSLMHDLQEEMIITAILHDTIEDCKDEERPDLKNEIYANFGMNVTEYLNLLTHDAKKQSYGNYIYNLANNFTCRAIKYADLIVNVTDKPKEENKMKYRLALIFLKNKEYLDKE